MALRSDGILLLSTRGGGMPGAGCWEAMSMQTDLTILLWYSRKG